MKNATNSHVLVANDDFLSELLNFVKKKIYVVTSIDDHWLA